MRYRERVETAVERCAPGREVVAAVSGGADSTAMLVALSRTGRCVVAAHCNFHLRGEESNRDEAAVRALCERLGIQLEVLQCDVDGCRAQNGGSVEMVCRDLRYNWFDQLLEARPGAVLMTAHNADDRIETLLFNMMRGTGLTGLRSIPREREGRVFRPLLDVSRSEIEDYLQSVGFSFVTDSTNLTCDYTRNRIRHLVLPPLHEAFPEARKGLGTTLDNIERSVQLFSNLISKTLFRFELQTGGWDVKQLLKELGSVDAPTLLYEGLKSRGMSLTVAYSVVSAASEPGTRFYMLGQERFRLHDGLLEPAACPTSEGLDDAFRISVLARQDSSFDQDRKRGVGYFSPAILDCELSMRVWREGDRFRPFGMRGSKLLSDLFTAAHIPADERRNIPLLLAGNEIVMVGSLRQADRFRVDDSCDTIVEVECMRSR